MYEAFGGHTHRNRLTFLKVTPSDVRGSVKVGLQVSAFYLVERYPLVAATGITEQDVRTSLELSEGLINKLRAGMHRE